MSTESVITLLNIIRNKVFDLSIPVDITDDVAELAYKHSLWQFLSRKNALYQVNNTLRQDWLLGAISDAFEKNKIDYIPLKGSVVKHLYPEMWMRSSGDIDILIHKDDMARAAEILARELEMELVREGSHCWEFRLGDLDAEIHYRLINYVMLPEAANALGDGWKYAVHEDGHKFSLSPEAFYLYHLAHMAVHILKGGCGIRPFVDLYLITHKIDMDGEKLSQMLEDAGLTQFEKRMREISESWMNGEYTCSEEEELIVNGGTFGFFEDGVAMSQAGNGGKRITMLKRVFLPFREMKYRYPILEKSPWLLPVCWIRYWFWVIKSGKLKAGARILFDNEKVDRYDYDRALRIVNTIGLGK